MLYNPKKEQYPYVLPNLEDWSLVKLTNDKEKFLKEVNDYTINYLLDIFSEDEISDEIARTIYLEKKRSKEEPWRVDPKSEKKFWDSISKSLIKKSLDKTEEEKKEVLNNNKQIFIK